MRLTQDDLIDGIEYDRYGRMKYHPEFHPNKGKRFNEEELEYLAKFFEVDGARAISFALGRPEDAIRTKYATLEKEGLLEYYRSLNHYV